MKTLLLVNTGNDAEIIAESLTHNEKFFDKIVIMDRASEDNTIGIIKFLNNPKITIHEMGLFEARHLPRLTQSILALYKDDYDFYIILDADEFIVADNLDELLEIPKTKVGDIPWKCYVPEKDTFGNFKQNITKRRTLEQEGNHKVVVPSSLDCMLSLGNHYVHDYYYGIYNVHERLPSVKMQTISIAHFPIRSREQYNNKIQWSNSLDRTGLNDDEFNHYSEQTLITTEEELKERAINYVGKIEGQELVEDPVK